MATSDQSQGASTLPFPTSQTVGSDLGEDGMSGGMGGEGTTGVSTSGNGSGGTSRTADELLNRVVQGAHQAIDRLADTVAPHVRRVQEGVSTANETLQQRADQVREKGDELSESLRTTVREHPLAAVATALAVGILVARLTR